jgi:hypothetical protein
MGRFIISMINRVINFFIDLAIRIVLMAIRMTFRFILWALPYVLQVIWSTILIMCASVASLAIGLGRTTDRIANLWLNRAADMGVPTIFDTSLYWTFRFTAFFTLVFGWVALAASTIGIIKLVVLIMKNPV